MHAAGRQASGTPLASPTASTALCLALLLCQLGRRLCSYTKNRMLCADLHVHPDASFVHCLQAPHSLTQGRTAMCKPTKSKHVFGTIQTRYVSYGRRAGRFTVCHLRPA